MTYQWPDDTPSPAPDPKAAHRDAMSALEALEADYELVRQLGSGGMADVYLAHDRVLGREVAIKVIRSALLRDDEAAPRLMREVRTVTHPGIVTLFAARPIGAKGVALVMAYFAGGRLRDRLRRQPQRLVDEALRIVGEVAAALDHAHALGVVHRDVKPENIFFDGATCIDRSERGEARTLHPHDPQNYHHRGTHRPLFDKLCAIT